jgi:hypothetical protein
MLSDFLYRNKRNSPNPQIFAFEISFWQTASVNKKDQKEDPIRSQV